MLRKDFLIRQLNEFVRALLTLLLHSKGISDKDVKETISQTYSFLNLTKDNFRELTFEDIITHFEEEPMKLEKLELTGLLLLEEYNISENKEDDRYLQDLGKDILLYVDKNSNTYSLERKILLG